jgi:hypothetical protein
VILTETHLWTVLEVKKEGLEAAASSLKVGSRWLKWLKRLKKLDGEKH